MPIFWMGFSLQTSPAVDPLKHKPKELREMVREVVEKSDPHADRKPELLDLYFQVDKQYACALIKDLDDYVALKAVMDVLGADYATKFLTAEGAEDANELGRRIAPKRRAPGKRRPPTSR
jgi:hypothetical protein